MKRFLYYLPGVPGANVAMLRARGLWDRFVTVGEQSIAFGVTQVLDGPDKRGGCLVAAGAEPAAYDPRQPWLQSYTNGVGSAAEEYWVGLEDLGGEGGPGPDELARELAITGLEVTLADHRVWRPPVLLQWDRNRLEHVANVPMVLTVRQGKTVVEVAPMYRAAYDLAQAVLADFMQERTITLDLLLMRAAAVLAVNYRVGMTECALLGLFDQARAVAVLKAAVDAAGLEDQAREFAGRGLEYLEPEEGA